MRHLLLMTLLLSFMAIAQEKIPESDEASLYRVESDNTILLKTYKLAAPVTSGARNQPTVLGFPGERVEVSTDTPLGNDKRGDFSCPHGTDAACLEMGDKVCPGSARCVDDHATCFDEYPCDLSEGFVCGSKYDSILDSLNQVVRQHDELALENVALRERRLEQKNCVINAATLNDAIRCVRQ